MNTGKNENTIGIGVFLGDAGVGVKNKNKIGSENITRINFTIPIALPCYDTKK